MRRLVELRNTPLRFSGGPLGTVFYEYGKKGGGLGWRGIGRDWEGRWLREGGWEGWVREGLGGEQNGLLN